MGRIDDMYSAITVRRVFRAPFLSPALGAAVTALPRGKEPTAQIMSRGALKATVATTAGSVT